jgi:hypothetical protein
VIVILRFVYHNLTKNPGFNFMADVFCVVVVLLSTIVVLLVIIAVVL